MDGLADLARKNPFVFADCLSRVVPAERTFAFQSPEEFEANAREIALGWVPRLAGRSFHVRLHRRGFKGRLSTPAEERFLDDVLLQALQAAGTPGSLSFEDPDAVVAVETVGDRAGMSLWTRDELLRHPFLKPD
jgi:tRNA(Ser,Leu) C12 N-acetylase TAN1